jgi:TrpR-related protein YerC/YecD
MLPHRNERNRAASAASGKAINEDLQMSATEAWRDEAASELFEAILRLESTDEASAFFRDLCTLGELHDLAQRWAVVRLLDAGMHYAEISHRTGASTATITRIAQWLHHGEGGYAAALERLHKAAPAAPAASGEPTR